MNQYFEPKFPGAFSGLENFYRNLKSKASKQSVRKYMGNTYSLHFPVKKKFERNKFIVKGIDHTWQADLVDMQSESRKNKGFKFILTVIDVFSKYAWAVPIKNKSGIEVTRAFEKIFSQRIPKKMHVDRGREFYNRNLRALLKKHNIHIYSTKSEMKASVVERFNRTLKEKMWRMFTYTGKKRYVDALEDLVSNYNNSYHRSIKTKPILVTKQTEYDTWLNLYGCTDCSINISLQENDLVRISRKKYIFSKGYTKNWSREIFRIKTILPNIPPKYIVEDLEGDSIKGTFYEQELQKI